MSLRSPELDEKIAPLEYVYPIEATALPRFPAVNF